MPRPRVRIQTDLMVKTQPQSMPGSPRTPRSPRSPRTPKGRLPGEGDSPRKIRNIRNMARLRKITASPCEMNSPGGPKLSPRKAFVPHIAIADLSLAKQKSSKKSGSHLRHAQPTVWEPARASPGTRKYLETSFKQEALKIDTMDNGEQHLLRALLVENTIMDPSQLYKACEYFERSIQVRDSDEKVSRRMYNYASFCMWRLGDVEKAEQLYRNALALMPSDPELSFALAEFLYLRAKPQLAKNRRERENVRPTSVSDSDDDEDCAEVNFPPRLQQIVNEATELFERALEEFEEEVAVVLTAGEFFCDIGDVERAQELFDMANEAVVDDDEDDSDEDSDEENEETEDPMKFCLRRKKLSSKDVKLRWALFMRDYQDDTAAALEVLGKLLRRSKNDIEIIVALADTLRVAWEKSDPSDRSPGLEDEGLRRAARLCVRGRKLHPTKASTYWSLGLILRCRGTPTPDAEVEDESESKSRGKRRKRKKRKKRNRKNIRLGNVADESPSDLRQKGLVMLLKCIQLETHLPSSKHLLYVAQILASDAEAQKQANLSATIKSAAKKAISSLPTNMDNKIQSDDMERIKLARSFFEQAYAVNPLDPEVSETYADFLIKFVDSLDMNVEGMESSISSTEIQETIKQSADLLESAASSDIENMRLQNKTADFLESKSMFRRADRFMSKVVQSMLKKSKLDDPVKGKDTGEEYNFDSPRCFNNLSAIQDKFVKRYAEFLILRCYQFTRAHQLLSKLGEESLDEDYKERFLSVYDEIQSKRQKSWKEILDKKNVISPPEMRQNKSSSKSQVNSASKTTVDRVAGTIVLSKVRFLRDVLQDNETALEIAEAEIIPYTESLLEESSAAESTGASTNTILTTKAKYSSMKFEIARLYALEERYDEAFSQLSSIVTNAGYKDANILQMPVTDGGFAEVGVAVGEKKWTGIIDMTKANAGGHEDKVSKGKKKPKAKK